MVIKKICLTAYLLSKSWPMIEKDKICFIVALMEYIVFHEIPPCVIAFAVRLVVASKHNDFRKTRRLHAKKVTRIRGRDNPTFFILFIRTWNRLTYIKLISMKSRVHFH